MRNRVCIFVCYSCSYIFCSEKGDNINFACYRGSSLSLITSIAYPYCAGKHRIEFPPPGVVLILTSSGVSWHLQEVLDGLAITNDHFKYALQHCNPSALRETLVEVRHRARHALRSTPTYRNIVFFTDGCLFCTHPCHRRAHTVKQNGGELCEKIVYARRMRL